MPADRRPLTRVRSSRLTKKVSCETLSLSSSDCELPCNAQSDDDLRIDANSNAGEEQHVINNSKLAIPSYGHGKLENRPPFPAIGRQQRTLAWFLSKWSFCECSMSAACSPRRKRKPLRKFPSSVHGSTGLLPHSVPIILPIGSHSAPLNNMSSKAPGLLKASSLIPSNAVSGKMSALVIRDPCSPKVTCLGRVQTKQQSRKRSGGDVLDDGNNIKERQPPCLAMYRLRQENKAGNATGYHSPTTYQKRREKLGFPVKMLVNGDDCLDKSKDTTSKRKGTRSKKASKMAKHTAGELEGKPRHISKESTRLSQVKTAMCKEMNAFHPIEQNWQIAHHASPLVASSSEAEVCMNLGQFASIKSQQQLKTETSSSCVADRSQRYGNRAREESVRQAPPQDALLRMRNSRPKDVRTMQRNGDSSHVMQEPPQNALLMMKGSRCKESYVGGSRRTSLNELRSAQETGSSAASSNYGVVGKVATTHFQPACDAPPLSILRTKSKSSNMRKPSSRVRNTQNGTFCQLKKAGIRDRQESLPNVPVSLWQRRAVRKPYDLDVRTESRPPNTST